MNTCVLRHNIAKIMAHDFEVRLIAKDAVMHPCAIELEIRLLHKAANRHMHEALLFQSVAASILVNNEL